MDFHKSLPAIYYKRIMLHGDGSFYHRVLSISFSRGRKEPRKTRARPHPFKEDFFSRPFFEQVRAPRQQELEFLRDRSANVFMLDNHSREDPLSPMRINDSTKTSRGTIFANTSSYITCLCTSVLSLSRSCVATRIKIIT